MNATTMILATFLALFAVARAQLPSPCPDVLKYEPREKDADRWYATITLMSPEELDGVWIHIRLDNRADVLLNWFGESTSTNNMNFLIKNERYVLPAGKPETVKIAVKFNLVNNIPSVTNIRLNGGVICAAATKPRPAATEAPSVPPPPEQQRPPPAPAGNSLKPVEYAAPVQTYVRNSPEDICGTVPISGRPLIYNGQQADDGQWPWHLAIAIIKGEKLTYSCGGSLVSNQYVVTAGHCVTKFQTKIVLDVQNFLLYLGTNNLRSFGPGAQVVQVSEITVHPDYHARYYYNDIAVLKLSRTVEFTDYVRPICLWEGETNLDRIVGKRGTVVGWGVDNNNTTTTTLNEATMPIVRLDECIYSDRDFYSQFTTEKTFCAGNKNSTTVCRGDSGGGMSFPKSGTSGKNAVWQLRGLVSVSRSPEEKTFCETKSYVVFTDVAKYTAWIKTTAKIQ